MKTIIRTLLLLLVSTTVFAGPRLNSHPTATATIYLDFDGHTVTSSLWNSGNPIYCAAPALNDAQITEIFNRVSEDYRPFQVNITTDSVKFLAAPLTQRIRIIVTPTSGWRANVGGIAYIGSFTWGDDTPAFVFSDRLGPNNTKFIGECISHESGHTLGLSHQSRYDNSCTLSETYHSGIGSGETSWAPIMGNSYSRNMTGWHNGATPYGCANTQDNLSILTSVNGFGYRTDDYSDLMNSNAHTPAGTSFSIDGIITTSNDKDVFRFVLPQLSGFNLLATPYGLGTGSNGSNLDIRIQLYNEQQVLLRTYDPQNAMGISIDTTLKAGTYYFVLEGAGNANISDYGSIGSFTLTGFRSALPIQNVTLNGAVSQDKHQLNWNVVADEPLRSLEIEYSLNGIDFRLLQQTSAVARNLNYTPQDPNTRYYRIKATSVIDQVVYSNVIALRGTAAAEKAFTVGTLVQSQIQIRAAESFRYLVMDMNGRTVFTGRGTAGLNQIQWPGQASGMYVIRLIGTNHEQTERIIKQ
jgi:hypothetical protein